MRFLPPVLAALALAGCGSSSQTPPSAGTGPGITVKQALAARTTDPLLVRGSVVAEGGTIRLCYAILESYPPQCGKPALVVVGLELQTIGRLTTANGVTWSDREIRLLGTVTAGTLTVTVTAVA
jgi:hypothetical protein